LKELNHSDVWALNEHELTAQEKEDIHQVRERNGVVLEEVDVNAERVVATVASVREGQCWPSWLWFTGNVHENIDDPLTCTGVYKFITLFKSLADVSPQPYKLNGQRQRHAPGRRK
jgi:hypothetical protein